MNKYPVKVIITILCCGISTESVDTDSGRIEGKTVFHGLIPVKAYLGIPYAKPPVGDLQFKKPVPAEPWKGTLQADEFAPGCIQYVQFPFPYADTLPGLSQDCLYLNIWTPITSSIPIISKLAKKTVMFWIYGGGYQFGSSRVDFFNGQALAAEGDVVVVTINYRLGADGFFYSGTEDAPGNMGLWDTAEALKWVRNNIESFGGDKNSITLFGQSAGAFSAGMFTVSPVTRGMFKRIIMQSGSPTNLNGKDNNQSFRTSQSLAEAVGCANDEDSLEEDPKSVVECMRTKNASEVAVTLSRVSSGRVYYPRYGDDFLPMDPRKAIMEGKFEPVDVLLGVNSGDGSVLLTQFKADVFGFFGEKDPQINLTYGESILRERFKSFPDPDELVKQYLGDVQEDDYDKIRYEVFSALGDYERVCPATYFAESFAQKKDKNLYYYNFTHMSSNSPWAPWMLAVHFEETPFVFGYPLRYPRNYTLEERLFSRRLLKSWSNFAKTGNPRGGAWPQYSRESPRYQELDVGKLLTTGKGPHSEKCDFFRPYFGF